MKLSNSPKGLETIQDLYYQKLDGLSIAYEQIQIETSFGKTNVIVTGPSGKPPLVLLHGFNSCAPQAIESLKGLISTFKVYAIDVVGQPNLSDLVDLNYRDDSFGHWMYEILSRLNIWNVTLVGISFGGFVALKALLFDTKRITKTFLLMPAGIIRGNLMKIMLNVCLPIKIYKQWKLAGVLAPILAKLYTKPDPILKSYMPLALAQTEMKFWEIPLISKIQAQKIEPPIYIVAAKQDLLFPGVQLLQRALTIFPNIDKSLLLEKSKHYFGPKEQERIVEFIKKAHSSMSLER